MGTLTTTTKSAAGTLTTSSKHGTRLQAGLILGLFPYIYTYAGDSTTPNSILTLSSKASQGTLTTSTKH